MNRLSFVSLCTLVVLVHHIVSAQERKLVAEGDSVAVTTSETKTLSHWQLWRTNEGYEAVDSNARNTSIVQIFRFDSKFMPTGFTRKSGPLELPDAHFPKSPGFEISCEYETKEAVCESIAGNGTRSTTTIAAMQPYVVTGEFYDLDFLWFMTGVVHLASKGKTGGLVDVYAVTSGKGPKDIGLKADKPIRVISDGDGSATALGRVQPIKKYKWGSDN